VQLLQKTTNRKKDPKGNRFEHLFEKVAPGGAKILAQTTDKKRQKLLELSKCYNFFCPAKIYLSSRHAVKNK